MHRHLTETGAEWRERVGALQAELDLLRPQLIDAEAQLAERLAAINAFEFRLRARLGHLSRRLDDIQREIDELREEMRRLQANWMDAEAGQRGHEDAAWRFDREQAAEAGTYRYRDARPAAPSQPLEADQQAELKAAYRRLARRFHPDLALNEGDREYRTSLMIAINAAYTAGNLAELERLALEPDTLNQGTQTDEALAEALDREVKRCRCRLDEIRQELATLEQHPNARLLRRAERAAAEGRDLIDEMARDLRRQISEKLVERDVLETQLEDLERAGEPDEDVDAGYLADIVFTLGLEQAGEEDLLSPFDNWDARQKQRWSDARSMETEEDNPDETD